jgi:hypothetical protein
MADIFENDKKFKEAIGAFIIAFSELEYGLAFLSVLTEFDLRKRDEFLLNHIGLSFENKVRKISDYIDNHLQNLKPIWDIQKNDIGQLNRERRFIAHGFVSHSLPHESISTYVKEKKILSNHKFDVETIKKLTNKLHHLDTGENGINGEFRIDFTKQRIDQWNKLVNDENKIVYKVNSEILSDWKGKK